MSSALRYSPLGFPNRAEGATLSAHLPACPAGILRGPWILGALEMRRSPPFNRFKGVREGERPSTTENSVVYKPITPRTLYGGKPLS